MRFLTWAYMPSKNLEYSLYPSSASLFHFAIDDGRYIIHGKVSTRYRPGLQYPIHALAKAFIFIVSGSCVESVGGRSYMMDSTVDAPVLHSWVRKHDDTIICQIVCSPRDFTFPGSGILEHTIDHDKSFLFMNGMKVGDTSFG